MGKLNGKPEGGGKIPATQVVTKKGGGRKK